MNKKIQEIYSKDDAIVIYEDKNNRLYAILNEKSDGLKTTDDSTRTEKCLKIMTIVKIYCERN
jgi:predicted membrane protein